MPIESGTKLGPYEILALIGAGGMGEVYRARDTRLDRIVAVKVLPRRSDSDPEEFRERFEREARAVSSSNHPHICALYDVGNQDGIEFLRDGIRRGRDSRRSNLPGPPRSEAALNLAIEIADALDKAHRAGCYPHRDLKPGNIMLTKAGAKLLDFGLARAQQPALPRIRRFLGASHRAQDLTARGAILGTCQYMAPEQLEGQEADARTDIFAFGAVLLRDGLGPKSVRGKSQASLIGAILERDPPRFRHCSHHHPRLSIS